MSEQRLSSRRQAVLPIRQATLVIVCMATGQAAPAATWTVEADPANPEQRIEAVVQQAASGDTILVGPGLFYEHIAVPQTDLTIIGGEGAEVTILDGERSFPLHQGSIISGVGGLGTLRLEGLAFQHGQGSAWDGPGLAGGAVYCSSRDLEVSDCRFTDNQVLQTLSYGGAIGILGSPRATVRRSNFANNNCTRDGGTLYAEFCDALTLEDCHVETPDQLQFSTIYCYGGYSEMVGHATLDRCNVTGGLDSQAGAQLAFGFFDTTIRDSQFLNYREGVLEFGGDLDDVDVTVILERNRFWRDQAAGGPDQNWHVRTGGVRMHFSAVSNTFSRVDLEVDGVDLRLERNIFSEATCSADAWQSGEIRCNCSWPDSIRVDAGSPVSIADNLVADPLLCDEALGDLHIAAESPCAPDHSPPGCDLIGALDVGCNATPVLRTSWGRLKYLLGGRRLERLPQVDRGGGMP